MALEPSRPTRRPSSPVVARPIAVASHALGSAIDLTLTAEEFRARGDLVAIGPIPGADDFRALVDEFEKFGLAYFEDFSGLSANWPE